jgi:hypothetical protein
MLLFTVFAWQWTGTTGPRNFEYRSAGSPGVYIRRLPAAPVNSAKGIPPVSLAGFAVLILGSLLHVAPRATLAVVASTTAAIVVVGLTAETMLAGGQLESRGSRTDRCQTRC